MKKNLVDMKILIDALKIKPYSKKELIDILRKHSSSKSSEALRKKCERSLEKLHSLGLIEKRHDKYCWYIYVNDLKDLEDFNVKLLHSKKLIPALKRLAGIEPVSLVTYLEEKETEERLTPDDMSILLESAEDHLRAIPVIWKLLEELRELNKKVEKKREQFKDNLMEKLRKEFGFEPLKAGHVSFLTSPTSIGNNIPTLIYERIRYWNSEPPKINIDDKELIWLENRLVGKGKKVVRKIENFLKCEVKDESNIKTLAEIIEIENRAVDVLKQFQREIRKLILKIESGEPLVGGCDTCPKVSIKSEGC